MSKLDVFVEEQREAFGLCAGDKGMRERWEEVMTEMFLQGLWSLLCIRKSLGC